MKKLVLLSLLFMTANTFADELHNFDQVKSAVMTGKSIRIAVDFSKCTTEKNLPLQDKFNIGIFSPNEIVIDSSDRINASLMHFTLSDQVTPAKPVYQFLRYTITSDSNLKLSFQVLDATNYASLANKVSFDCKIDSGVKIYD